jgi:hypothetical protein
MKRVEPTDLSSFFTGRKLRPAELYSSRSGRPDQKFLVSLYAFSGLIVDFLGPMFWAALFVLLIEAELAAG